MTKKFGHDIPGCSVSADGNRQADFPVWICCRPIEPRYRVRYRSQVLGLQLQLVVSLLEEDIRTTSVVDESSPDFVVCDPCDDRQWVIMGVCQPSAVFGCERKVRHWRLGCSGISMVHLMGQAPQVAFSHFSRACSSENDKDVGIVSVLQLVFLLGEVQFLLAIRDIFFQVNFLDHILDLSPQLDTVLGVMSKRLMEFTPSVLVFLQMPRW